MTPGKRLLRLAQLAGNGHQHIWDCCCDHGQLGAALLNANAAEQVHFVDIVPALMTRLEQQLSQWYPGGGWQTWCLDVTNLPLQHMTGRQRVIIAGVGGELMARMLTSLTPRLTGLDVDFLLCAVNHQQHLRQTLRTLGFGLHHEELLEENHRCYELLHVCPPPHTQPQPSLVGEHIWLAHNEQQHATANRYYQRTLQHLTRMQQGGRTDVTHWIETLHQQTEHLRSDA